MNRVKWYGPTIALLATVLCVLVAGPHFARKLAYEYYDARIFQVMENQKANVSLANLSEAFKNVARIVEKSVVSITVYSKRHAATSGIPEERLPLLPPNRRPKDKSEFDDYDVPQQYGSGSGWIYDTKGHIITNNHVVDGADRIVVRFYDGSERDATVVGVDTKTDVAVVKVKGDDLLHARRAKEPVDQGEIVFAFGSPFRFDFSMSQGIVSAKGRQLGILRGAQGYENFIQTDAAINPGNSGGPLTNIYGEVVGMNTAIASRTGAYNGLGFAIPIKMVEVVAEQLIESGKVSRGYLGVFIRDLTPQLGRSFGFEGKGVLVEQPIEGSPGAKAGMLRGDIVTKVNGVEVTTADELRNYVASLKPGTKVAVDMYRLEKPSDTKGKMVTIDLVVGEQPDAAAIARITPGTTPPGADDGSKTLGKLGIDVEDFAEATALRLGVKFVPGVIVTKVRAGSVAEAADMRVQQVIVDVQGKPVANVKQFIAELGKHDLEKGVRISVLDGDTPRYVFLELSK
ncbi:MAG: trypsin-like peptidase domain-containing protein [Phycisphaeraceae bacterium]